LLERFGDLFLNALYYTVTCVVIVCDATVTKLSIFSRIGDRA